MISNKIMTSVEIRQKFLDFFEAKNHSIVPSAPMVIKDDPTLMFTNAGMNQFKDVILGNITPKSRRVADSQKCLRVSGKHNDLEEVGYDTYHHTMFEMLGNWSFGDYFKEDAISYAWEFLTETMGLDKGRLYVTIFEGSSDDKLEEDVEAQNIWKQHIAEDRILKGNKKDNFWEMGDMGPCGPCSEIHIDLRDDSERQATSGASLVNKDHPLVVEIWNLVFMQFNRKADGSLELLSNHHVDTGMGFERLCMAVQGKKSNYDTDVFTPIISEISALSGVSYTESEKSDIAMRVIADHLRTIAFSIADGQMPSNVKAGYVIRRILRRAVRYAYTYLHQKDAFMYKLVHVLVSSMGKHYPELIAQRDLIKKVIREEENSFLKTLERGINLLDRIIDQVRLDGGSKVSGKIAFELYDTYGFPLDLTELILREQNFVVDKEGFEKAMMEQKERSRSASAIDTDDWVELFEDQDQEFVGYDWLETDVKIARYRKVKIKNKTYYHLVFNMTPFFGESGGQIGDKGILVNDDEEIEIIDTKKETGLTIHITEKLPKNLNTEFKAKVNVEKRTLTANNHTATHLLDYALRKVLGKHVEQKGSYVSDEYLRFDFSHFQKVTEDELSEVERIANDLIHKNLVLEEFRRLPIDKAKEMGAIALFGEKYGDTVRVIKFGESIELCGGTHVASTNQIGIIKITSESSVAAGVRRIEAISADCAFDFFNRRLNMIEELEGMFKTQKNIFEAVSDLFVENENLKKELEKYKKAALAQTKEQLKTKITTVGDTNVIVERLDISTAEVKDLAFQLRAEVENLVFVIGGVCNEKPHLTIILNNEVSEKYNLNASVLVRELAKEIKGGGGGQVFFATAGGADASGIKSALKKANEIILTTVK